MTLNNIQGLENQPPKDQGVKPGRRIDQILSDDGQPGCATFVCFDRRKPTSSNGLKAQQPKAKDMKAARRVDQILHDEGLPGCARSVCSERGNSTFSHGLKAQPHIAQGFSPGNRITYIAACRVARTHFAAGFLATLQAALRINRTPEAEAPGYVRLGLQPILSPTLIRILLRLHPEYWIFSPFRQQP